MASRTPWRGTAAPAGCELLQHTAAPEVPVETRRGEQRETPLPGRDLDAHAAVAFDLPHGVVRGAFESEGCLEQAQDVERPPEARPPGPAALCRFTHRRRDP